MQKMTKSLATSKHIFNITAEQRAALCSPQLCCDDVEFNEILKSIKQTYNTEGFVLIRGLLDDDAKERLVAAGHELQSADTRRPPIGNQFNALEFGSAFNSEKVIFREVALDSAIPAVIAKVLLDIEEKDDEDGDEKKNDTTLRLLKDAFMAKGKEELHCGWHVDDNLFWPTDSSSSGVNVWLSLDEMPAEYGGGMAVSPKSHTAEWRRDAYTSIGSTPTLPPEGVSPAQLRKTFGQTCNMASLNEEINAKIESTKLVFDYQPGDCLFCHRWLFHRSTIINEDGMNHYDDNSALKRYTIRYERGSAKLIQGVNLEPSVLIDPQNSGKSLDEVCEINNKPFYPRCWPPLQVEEKKLQSVGMDILSQEIFPLAQKKKIETIQGLMAAGAGKA
mmetsp:Transcript_4548/g.9435  ORF Transcript_4548/g.9435 Transcript_4548/m.9435 type:complete len:390 (-) Transcript_4548:29-1198(-)